MMKDNKDTMDERVWWTDVAEGGKQRQAVLNVLQQQIAPYLMYVYFKQVAGTCFGTIAPSSRSKLQQL